MTDNLKAGQVFRVPYPFVRTEFTEWNEDGPAEIKSWKPGTNFEERFVPPDDCEVGCVADGMGEMILTVISIHKPGRFPTRVFYTRRWVRPDGREFGKTKCHCAITSKFRRLARGYQHEFTLQKVAA